MTTPSTTEERDNPLATLLAACGQEHALRWWPELTQAQRQRLHQQLAGIDLEQLQRLFRQTDPAAIPDQAVRPAPVLGLARTFEDREMSNLFAAWLNSAGIEVARRADGSAAVPIEISPLLALDAEEFRRRLHVADRVTEPLLLDAPALVGGTLSKLKLTRARDRMNIPGGRSAGSLSSSDSEAPADRTAFSSPRREHTCHADTFC